MKLKNTWVVFIPAFLSAMGVQLFQSISLSDPFTASLTAVIITAVMIGITSVIACADKYTVRDYPPRKNVFSGVMLILTGVFVAIYGINGLSVIFDEEIKALQIISIVVSLLSAIVFILLGINIATGNFTVTTAPVLTLVPVVFFAIELVKRFIAYTKEAVSSSEMYDMLYLIFLLLFFYYCASIYAGIPTKYAIKSCFVFGMPAILLTFAWCIKKFFPIFSGKEAFDFVLFLPEFIALFASIFTLSFLLEISLKASVTNYFAIDDDDEDFSEEERLFGISGNNINRSKNKTAYKSPYEDMTRFGKKNDSASEENSNNNDDEILNSTNSSENDNDIEKIVSEFENSRPETRKEESLQPETDDDDLGWIDRLIKDIEEEQNK